MYSIELNEFFLKGRGPRGASAALLYGAQLTTKHSIKYILAIFRRWTIALNFFNSLFTAT